MDIDRDHIDDAVPALLFLGASRRHAHLELLRLGRDGAAPYKGIDLGPVDKAKSLVFTDEGLRQSEALFRKLFTVGREA